ncbi:MAG: hypothetical protein ABIG69_15975 [Bacteroidota bacterium]
MRTIKFITLFTLIAASLIYAHEKKEHYKVKSDSTKDTITIVGEDTIAVNGIPVNTNGNTVVAELKEEPFELNPAEQLFAHLHNKIIHFPLALTLVAFLFSILNIKQQSHCTYQSIKILLGISLFASISAYFTGNFQITAFIGDPKEWLANTHRLSGIISSILILLWFIALFIERIKKYSWLIGIFVVISISLAGFLGGVLAH